MKAMYIKEPGQVEFIDVEKPVRKKGEVLLKLLYGGFAEVTWVHTRGLLRTSIIQGFPAMNFPRKSLRQMRITNRVCVRE